MLPIAGRKREREIGRERVCVRESVCERERKGEICVFDVRVCEFVCVCVCVCVCMCYKE